MKPFGFLATLLFVLVVSATETRAQWVQINELNRGGIFSLVVSGTNLFAGTDDGVFLSTDNGTRWTAVNSGFPGRADIRSIVISGTNVFAGTALGSVWRRPLSEMMEKGLRQQRRSY